ncbi:hypothetical protein GmRootV59_13160 [Variovorax sp. V59]|uniref:hypothetical protein n=1 Tax=unclassified Variovorax TaxID=663243 RepID=UPI0034E8F390
MVRAVKLGSMAPGLNNRLPPTQLARTLPDRSKATFLYAGENIDITGRGYLKRREGFAAERRAPATHSVWGDETEGYCAAGNDLLHLVPTESGLAASVVLSGLPELQPISYARMPDGDVIWSNGFDIGRLRGASALLLGTLRPAVAPGAALTTGALAKGRYQVAFTELGPLGESGSTVPVVVDVPADGGGIALSGQGPDTQVYVTGPNGSIFNRIDTDGDIVSLANTGAPLADLMMADMPPGSIVRHYKGSLLVANGPYLFFSEPYYYALYKPSKGYIPFPAPITVVEPCETGVFVCADRAYWLAGALLDTQPAVVQPYGGLPGSGGSMRTSDGDQATTMAFWLSPRGLVIGTPNGAAANVQESALKFGAASAGATLFREQDGANHILAARQDAARPFAASAAFPAIESIVKGTEP